MKQTAEEIRAFAGSGVRRSGGEDCYFRGSMHVNYHITLYGRGKRRKRKREKASERKLERGLPSWRKKGIKEERAYSPRG